MSKKKEILNKTIEARYPELTSKSKKLAEFTLSHPEKAVFMTTRELAAAVEVSEATVVRFVRQLHYPSYASFITSLKELIDTRLTLIDREKLLPVFRSDDAELERITNQDIANIRAMSKRLDLSEVKKIKKILKESEAIHIIGSRLSYAPAYYLGWTMTKVRKNVHILKGSDRTTIDWLTFASKKSAVLIVATSRYPNELIRMGFSDHVLIAPLQSIPFLGNPASLISLINYLVHSLAADMGEKLKIHQEQLEQAYLENDILFYY